MTETINVKVQLLDKFYTFRCAPGEEERLHQAVLLLDSRMRKLREQNVTGLERITLLAALELSHDLLACQQLKDQMSCQAVEQINTLNNKIQDSLTQHEQIEL